jgi:lon-related putative ATP-dependent protease
MSAAMPDSPRPDPSSDLLVDAADLRWSCDPGRLGFRDTSEIDSCPIEIIGQPRATAALSLGLELRSEGYNIFVAGEVGTGRSTAVRRIIARMAPDEKAPPDLVYVHNFKDPDRPRLLAFPAGQGRRFRDAMLEVVRALGSLLPRLFESEAYRERKAKCIDEAKAKHRALLKDFEERSTQAGFALAQVQMGEIVRPELVPMIDDKPVSIDDLQDSVESGAFERERFEALRQEHARLTVELGSVTKEIRAIQRALQRQLLALDRKVAEQPVREALADLLDEFDQVEVRAYLEQATGDVLDRLPLFRQLAEGEGGDEEGDGPEIEDALVPYRVNLLVDNTEAKGRPILWESSPTFRNLFGTVERTPTPTGMTDTDHMRIKPGSLVRANGGFLVVDALDLLVEPGVWPALKRTLRTHELEIQSYDPRHPQLGSTLQPEPIPLDLKVVMIGTRQIYRQLHALDEDFTKIFKIKSEFALRTDRSVDEMNNYACFVLKKVGDDGLPHFTSGAVAAVIEHGVRLAGRRDKLTTQFNQIADLIRESGFWARRGDAGVVDVRHVDRAIEEHKYRFDLVEEVLRERIASGSVLVDVAGEVVGQVNGLVVLDVGDHRFGQPARITATTAMGRSGILDIERESEMSGPIHAKGVLILAGFLRERFAQGRPLTLSASLCFEQNYGLVEGDSASCAELVALLSSLADVPVRQAVAVTGSVNQKGEIQPIGGVNEKIEGFFDLCAAIGAEHAQGAVVPRRNLDDLMLRKDVVRAVREGRFRVWAVSTVEEAVELLTGMPAGVRGNDGRYPDKTLFARVERRLGALAEGIKEFGPADR